MTLSDFTTIELETELARRPDARERLRHRAFALCRQDGERIVREVAIRFNVPPEDITGRSRDLRTTRARHVAMAALLMEGYTLTQVGRFFGRHHTSVKWAVLQVRKPQINPTATP